MHTSIRKDTRREVESIIPLDDLERVTRDEVLHWIDSGADLWRIEKPATPDRHLVSYFPLIDGDYLLLVDHINAGLWLPTGGHIEPGEHPRATVLREVTEELSIQGEFLREHPVLVTSTVTVGKTAGHTDVSLWYALRGRRTMELVYDRSEFRSARWFHKDDIPWEHTDPQLHRFVRKVYADGMLM